MSQNQAGLCSFLFWHKANGDGTGRRHDGIASSAFPMDKEAITEWLVKHKYSDPRLIPQLHCPLCRQLNYERRIQGLQNRQAATEWSEAWTEH